MDNQWLLLKKIDGLIHTNLFDTWWALMVAIYVVMFRYQHAHWLDMQKKSCPNFVFFYN